MAEQATADGIFEDMTIGSKIFVRKERSVEYTFISFGLKNGYAISPRGHGIFQPGDHVFRTNLGFPQMIGKCENTVGTYYVPSSNASITANISLIKLESDFQVDNRLDFIWENEKKSFPLKMYKGAISPQTEVIIHGEIPRLGYVVRNPYSSSERNLFQVMLVSDPGAHSIRVPVDQSLLMTSVPQIGSVSLDFYGTSAGMVGNDYAVVPLYPSLYQMYGTSLGPVDSGISSM